MEIVNGMKEFFSEGEALIGNEIFPVEKGQHLKEVLEHYFNITSEEKNELTKYNLYVDENMRLYTDADRFSQFKKLCNKLKNFDKIGQEYFYVNFFKEEITGEELCELIKKFKEITRKSEKEGKIPEAHWEYFVFHCNQGDNFFHFHRIFEY